MLPCMTQKLKSYTISLRNVLLLITKARQRKSNNNLLNGSIQKDPLLLKLRITLRDYKGYVAYKQNEAARRIC